MESINLKINLYKAFGYLLMFSTIFGAIYIGGDIEAFIDIPTFAFVPILPLFLIVSLYGKDVFKFFKDQDLGDEIARKGLFITSFTSLIGTTIGIVIMLGNLSDHAAIGPAFAVALLCAFWGIFFMLTFFIPRTSKSAPLSLLFFPFTSIFMNMICLFILLVAFAKG